MIRERNFGVGSTLTHKGVRIRIELIPDDWSHYDRNILRDSLKDCLKREVQRSKNSKSTGRFDDKWLYGNQADYWGINSNIDV